MTVATRGPVLKIGRAAPATVRRTVFSYPTYLRLPARRLPHLFRGHWMNIYPETLDDVLGGPKKNIDYDAIILENEHLRLTILPDLGGKLFSVWDKNAGRDAVHVPDVIKPGLICRSGAWIPGGMEFNFPIGHTVYTMRPTPCSIEARGPECVSAVVHRQCARTGMMMDVRITLRRGEARFDIAYSPRNPTPLSHRWYHWTNVGVTTTETWRFFSKARWYSTGSSLHSYPINEQGVDTSYSANRLIGSDSFMVGHREDFFGCYDYSTRHGLAHIAPWQQMRGKKYFCWGWNYRDYADGIVFSDRGLQYNEIQAGPFETQQDFGILPPGGAVHYAETWIPFRDTAGIEWANRDLIVMVEAGKTWAYAGRALHLALSVNARRFACNLPPGQPLQLPCRVAQGDTLEIWIDGKRERRFAYPLAGRQEFKQVAQARWKYEHKPTRDPATASQCLDLARHWVKWEAYPQAISCYRKALRKKPRLHRARLELADALWHTGDFNGGTRELQKLGRSALAGEAQAMLARRAAAQAWFTAPARSFDSEPERQLALAERHAGYGGYDEALALYRKLLRSDRSNPRVWYGLALYWYFARNNRRRALPYAQAALRLRPKDRDYLIELLPILQQNGRYAQVIKILGRAPRDIRQIYLCQKLLARCYFELGAYERCWPIVSRVRLFNWEGESDYADLYIDCALALCRRALSQDQLRAALRFAKAAAVLPKTLGLVRRRFSSVRSGYWQGLSLKKLGRAVQARQVWQAALDLFDQQRNASAQVHTKGWHWHINPESIYMYGLCQRALGLDSAAFCQRVQQQRKAQHGKYRLHMLDGCLAELQGQFTKARALFKGALKRASHPRTILFHLQAVTRKRRDGEV